MTCLSTNARSTVVLYTGEDGERQAVELAAIRIVLDAFPALLRPEFIEGVRPFGGILARAAIRIFPARSRRIPRPESEQSSRRNALRPGERTAG